MCYACIFLILLHQHLIMHSTTRKCSTTADRASARTTAATSSSFSSGCLYIRRLLSNQATSFSSSPYDSQAELSSSSSPVPKHHCHGKAPSRSTLPQLPEYASAEESDFDFDGGDDVPRDDVTMRELYQLLCTQKCSTKCFAAPAGHG